MGSEGFQGPCIPFTEQVLRGGLGLGLYSKRETRTSGSGHHLSGWPKLPKPTSKPENVMRHPKPLNGNYSLPELNEILNATLPRLDKATSAFGGAVDPKANPSLCNDEVRMPRVDGRTAGRPLCSVTHFWEFMIRYRHYQGLEFEMPRHIALYLNCTQDSSRRSFLVLSLDWHEKNNGDAKPVHI